MFKQFQQYRDAEGNDEYLGNIWGWKVSFIGLGVLLFLLALYAYRVTYYPQPVNLDAIDKIERTSEKKKE